MEDSSEETSLPRSRSDSPVTMDTAITAFISQTGNEARQLAAYMLYCILTGFKKKIVDFF